MSLSYDSIVSLRTVHIRKDTKHYIVEDAGTEDFYEMPKVCVDAIGLMNEGKRLGEIEGVLKERFPDEDVDVLDFAEQLVEIGLVRELDGVRIERHTFVEGHSGYEWIPAGLGRFFFNRFTSIMYIGLLGASIVLLLLNPQLFPAYRDLFVFDDLMMKNIAAILVVTFVLVLLHELGHVLAVRSEGLPAKIGLGHRLFFIVLETDMTQVWKLPARKRNVMYLAGMYVDIAVMFMALSAQLFSASSDLVTGLLKLIVLNSFIRLVYQAAVFMKTDLYYVIENVTGCYNLMENGRNFLGKWLPFLKSQQTETFADEEKFVRQYAVFYLTGVVLAIAVTIYYYIPQLIFAVNQIMLPGFFEPFDSVRFWDSVVFLLQILLGLGLLLYSWSKKYVFRS